MVQHNYQYTLVFEDVALEIIQSLPKKIRQQIGYHLDLLQRDFTGDVKKLKGYPTEYRLRVGSYRILFELLGSHIVNLGHRKDIYAR